MYREVSKLILYQDLGEDSILLNMADILRDSIAAITGLTN